MKELKCPDCGIIFDSVARFCTQCATPLELIDVTCNLCGMTCQLGSECNPTSGLYGLIKQTVNGGYESTPGNGLGALDDCTSYTFSLCEFCLDWLFSQFKIPVEVHDYLSGVEPKPWRPAAERVAQDEWRRTKELFSKEHDRRKKAREAK